MNSFSLTLSYYINNDSAMLLLNFQQFGCHAREYCVTDGLARRDLDDVLFVNGVVVEVCYVTSNK